MVSLDNSELMDAAALFMRPHCPHCLVTLTEAEETGADRCPACDELLDADYPQIRVETAQRLWDVALAARESAIIGPNGYPVVTVTVQGPCDIPRCRQCGCTDLRACVGGCAWVADNLCSRCASHSHPGDAKCSG